MIKPETKKNIHVVYEEPKISFIPVMARMGFLRARSQECGYLTDGQRWLPFFIDHKAWIFRYMVFSNLPFPETPDGDDTEFISACVDLVRRERMCDFVFQPLSHVVLPRPVEGAKNRVWGTPIVDLSRSPEELFKSFHPKHRYEVRKAREAGGMLSKISPQEFHRLLASNEKGNANYTFPSLTRIQALLLGLGPAASLHGLVCKDRIVAGALVLHDQKCAYYTYGASEKGSIGWMHLLQTEIMDYYHLQGISHYDLVGYRPPEGEDKKYEGLARFKMRFSPTLIQGYTFWMPIKKSKVCLFRFALELRKLLTGKEFVF